VTGQLQPSASFSANPPKVDNSCIDRARGGFAFCAGRQRRPKKWFAVSPEIVFGAHCLAGIGTGANPRDLLRSFPSKALQIWPISTRANSPNNDDEHLLGEIALAS
jgi:hypothetical protein